MLSNILLLISLSANPVHSTEIEHAHEQKIDKEALSASVNESLKTELAAIKLELTLAAPSINLLTREIDTPRPLTRNVKTLQSEE